MLYLIYKNLIINLIIKYLLILEFECYPHQSKAKAQ
jgi:hypothetical protein